MAQLPLFIFGCVVFFTTITGVLLYGMYTLREIAERENFPNYAAGGGANQGSAGTLDEVEV